jgi:hypothetical protein
MQQIRAECIFKTQKRENESERAQQFTAGRQFLFCCGICIHVVDFVYEKLPAEHNDAKKNQLHGYANVWRQQLKNGIRVSLWLLVIQRDTVALPVTAVST